MPNSALGVIRIFPYTRWGPPAGWMACDGRYLLISEYPDLFKLIGTRYGGDGVTTFHLPDLYSSVVIGTSDVYTLGQTGGLNFVDLDATHLPPHTHTLNGMRSEAMISDAKGTQSYPSPGDTTLGAFTDPNFAAQNNAYNAETPDVPLNAGPPFTAFVGATGASSPIMITQPAIKMKFAMCVKIVQ